MTETSVIAIVGIAGTTIVGLGAPVVAALLDARRRRDDRNDRRIEELRDVLDAAAVAFNDVMSADAYARHVIYAHDASYAGADPLRAWQDRVEAVRRFREAHARVNVRLGTAAAVSKLLAEAFGLISIMGNPLYAIAHGYFDPDAEGSQADAETDLEEERQDDPIGRADDAYESLLLCWERFSEEARELIGPRIG